MTHDDAKRRSDQLAEKIKERSARNAKNAALNLIARSRSDIGLPPRGIIAKDVQVPLPYGGHVVEKLYEARFGTERFMIGTRGEAEQWIAKREVAWNEKRSADIALVEGHRLAHLAGRLVTEYCDRTKDITLSDRQMAALAKASAILAEMEEAFNGKGKE